MHGAEHSAEVEGVVVPNLGRNGLDTSRSRIKTTLQHPAALGASSIAASALVVLAAAHATTPRAASVRLGSDLIQPGAPTPFGGSSATRFALDGTQPDGAEPKARDHRMEGGLRPRNRSADASSLTR